MATETQSIQVGSIVTRKGHRVRGTVVAIYQVCGHPLRYHVGRARLSCQYKPHSEVGVHWWLPGAERFQRTTHMPLSRVVLVEG